MYNTLWIYGDSYAEDRRLDYQWFRQLPAQRIINRAQAGAANDYIAHTLEQDLAQHDSDDLVVVCTTHHSRQWFFESKPQLGNYLGIQDLEQQTDPMVFQTLKQYVLHLHHPLMDEIRGRAYTSLFLELARRTPAHALVIPGFDSVNTVTGVLTDITHGEFTNGGTFDNYYVNIKKRWGSDEDPRANHMMPNNHTVLAQKILAHLQGDDLDLTQGFDRDCL